MENKCKSCGYKIKEGEKVTVNNHNVICPKCGRYSGIEFPFPK